MKGFLRLKTKFLILKYNHYYLLFWPIGYLKRSKNEHPSYEYKKNEYI